jgi:hypothetical protein
MIKKTFYYLSAIIFVGAFIYFRLAPEKSEEIINTLTTNSESVEKKLLEPTQRVVQGLREHGITIDEQRWDDENYELPLFQVKATNRGETCMLELQAVISLKDGTTNTITLHNEGDVLYNGQTTWFECVITEELSDISSIQVFSFDIY